ncbi:HAD family hydrolase [Cellulomonas sp. zg-ZUI199]|uniref:HAD family hydrolase n=1 Tax=Cellulomonas wangleii TaxID=2816956 RepID=A0ABX8D7Q2_9CELL|nr:HAD family hydrolase [Cellulomonas wangleii]MBO0925133.1 HAD family hydrolase [Cellulomonas wangleii]QVI63459.1 HAD family hydrolase [Cellulomonas wangleii]
MRAVDGVLFDIDDTLVETRAAFRVALATVLARYAPGVDVDRALALWRADAGQHYRAYTRGELTFHEQRRTRANELHATLGGPALDEAGYRDWSALFDEAFASAWSAHADADPVLARLLDAGIRIGALSNARQDLQTTKLARAGLGERLEVLVGVDTLGFGKPDPRVFLEACRRLGTAPARTAYVGDELDVDAVASRQAGLVGVWLDRPGPRRVPVTEAEVTQAEVIVIRSLDELPAALGV